MSIHGKHTPNAGFESGNRWFECPRCGFDVRVNDTREEWTGLVVCKCCWEPRHPQDMAGRILEDGSISGPMRGPSPMVDSGPMYCEHHNARAGEAISGCARSGENLVRIYPEPTLESPTSGL